jgi:3-phosphoshikimate 1-carboxyvinyltransferase
MPAEIAGRALRAVEYHSPVASAQVKSAVLLAGLRADGVTTVVEPASSRDHTERMLPGFGVEVTVDEAGRSASVTGLAVLRACDVIVPADPSSAAFLVAGAVLVPGSHVRLPNVAVNPTRLAFARVLQRMGASIELRELPAMGGEPVATIVARHSVALGGVTVSAGEVPSLIDEVPVLAVVATQAAGTTRFEGVGELRVKESDRLQATHDALAALGADVRAGDDWLEVTGPTPLAGCTVASLGDHRLAMAWTIAGLVASGTTSIEGFEAVEVSYPAFAKDLAELGASVEVV